MMMMRRLCVMFCGSVVVLDRLFSLGHSSFPRKQYIYSIKFYYRLLAQSSLWLRRLASTFKRRLVRS
jgi:hypothetical protein